MKKKINIISIVLLTISILILIKSPVIECLLISNDNRFEEIAEDVFVQKNLVEKMSAVNEIADNSYVIEEETYEISNEEILEYIEEANNRGKEIFGELISSPKYIITTDRSLLKKYNGVSGGVTIYSALGSFIIIGPGGINTDAISHELVHGELYKRLGLIKAIKLPVWFNEGLACQIDNNENLSEEMLSQLSGRNEGIDIKSLNKDKEFYDKGYYDRIKNYILAKNEVETWLMQVETEGLLDLLSRYKAGEKFIEIYEDTF